MNLKESRKEKLVDALRTFFREVFIGKDSFFYFTEKWYQNILKIVY